MTCVSTVTQIGRGVVMAGAVAALMLTTNPIPAHAGGSDMGAAIGLGILGGVIAGAAVASSAPPYYGPSPYDYPAPGYYGPPAPGYYSQPAPGYYSAPPAYYWQTPYGYPQ